MPITLNRLASLLATTATGAALAFPACSAAASQANPASQSKADEGPSLATIVVTAQKRSETLLHVSAPVTALTSNELARQADTKLTDYASSVPGLNLISSEAGQTVVIIRGITTGFGASVPSTVATYIDDAPYGSSTANAYGSIATLDIDPGILKRVEVLRGPQGTLYGASALGGLIKYVTRPPSLNGYRGRLEAGTSAVQGGDQGYEVRAMFDGPLLDNKLGFTVSAFDRLDPGFMSDPHRNRENVNTSKADGGRIAFLWQTTDRLSAELSTLMQDTYTPSTSEVDLNSNMTPIYGKYEQVRQGNENWNFRVRQSILDVNYNFNWATLSSITSYATRIARWNIDESAKFGPLISSLIGIPNLGTINNVILNHHKITQEIRLTSPDGNKLEWLSGLFFTHEHSVKPEAWGQPFDILTDIAVPQAAQPEGLFTDTLHDSYTEYAGYGDLTYHLTSKIKVLGGVRVTSDSEQAVTPFSGIVNGPPIVSIGSSSSRTATYLFSPSYNIDDRSMIYARVATGFRPGGPTGVAATAINMGAPSTYRPDSLTNYEVGFKASSPKAGMTVDASAFDMEWKDIQVLTEINGFFVTGNGASARSNGVELAWTWRPISGLGLSANADYTDAYMTANAPPIGAKSGDTLPDVPKFSANLAADYEFPIGNAVSGFVGGNFEYTGARRIDFVAHTPAAYVRPVMPSYTVENIHAGVSKDGLTFEFYIKNVGNTYAFTRLRSMARDGFDPPFTASIIEPRTFGLTLTEEF